MTDLDRLEHQTVYIIREAYQRFRQIALLWSVGKDSTALLWMCRKAFFGRLPFPVLHIDTSYKFPEIYAFRDRYAKVWGLDLRVSRNEQALGEGMNFRRGRFECCNALKTEGLKHAIDTHHLKALLLGIRRDEHGIRAKERYFSPRDLDARWDYTDQPAELWDLYRSGHTGEHHVRVHPLLHWTEVDVWRYIQRERIPVVELYFAKGGRRYRSIGCSPCCAPVASRADTVHKVIRELETTNEAERSGRAQDKEHAYTMQKLRSLGYM